MFVTAVVENDTRDTQTHSWTDTPKNSMPPATKLFGTEAEPETGTEKNIHFHYSHYLHECVAVQES